MQKIKNTLDIETFIFAETFEHEAYEQLKRLINFEAYSRSKIRIMPDAHAGKGCMIGTTIKITDKITPNLVGVDIGCGMLTVKLCEASIDFQKLDNILNHVIPHGFNVNTTPNKNFSFDTLRRKKHVDLERAALSIGSLGGGNHFVEVAIGDSGLYLVVHSGSRKLGGDVCKYYQDKACKSQPANKDLAYLTGDDFADYINDMSIVQKFASLNRQTIADKILKELNLKKRGQFETIHNYIDFKRMILRKGAVSAENGELLLIPINMQDGSLLCRGKGNEDWNYSAPHGAGRLMSRSQAKKTLNMDDFKQSMDGIFTTSVTQSTLDEAPQAYKPIEEIKATITDTVEIIETIKPLYNFKAH